MTGFGEMHKKAVADGVLNTKVKKLIALAIGIPVRCDGCISFAVEQFEVSGVR